ncbi:hypothetical protein LUZ60_014165 [Juncus effusus]|nr:hypothetical protein LUZ60_014165 [Juncus effusus]
MAANVNIVANVKRLMDVSKRHFVPAPKVDSSLVSIKPKEDLGLVPKVDLKEWLGFTRVCFCKKNKTLDAIFKQKRMVLELFERTRSGRKNCVYSGIESFEESEERGNGGEEREREGVDLGELGVFKERIIRVLETRGFGEKRPLKLSNEELLCLLGFFNQEGVFFQ